MARRVRATPADETAARERIVDAAERLFAERGYDGTSTAKVAAAAGVPQGLVFYYFTTKLDLLLAIVRERPAQAVPPAERPPSGGPLRDLLERAVDVLAHELDRHRHTRMIIFREAHLHPEIHDRARQLVGQATAAIAEVLATADDAVDDLATLSAVAELVVRSQLIDAVLLRGGTEGRPLHYGAALDLLASAARRQAGAP